MLTDELDFLRESNNIENEWSDLSLQDSIHAWQYATRRKHLTVKDILNIHALLMRTRKTIGESDKGNIRTKPVYIGGHEAMNWTFIPNALNQWVINLNDVVNNGQQEQETFKEQICFKMHIKYEAIHPFIDGNGRSGRLLLSWMRVKLGLPIEVIYEREKQSYYKWFFK